jgi:hypothetical protein
MSKNTKTRQSARLVNWRPMGPEEIYPSRIFALSKIKQIL